MRCDHIRSLSSHPPLRSHIQSLLRQERPEAAGSHSVVHDHLCRLCRTPDKCAAFRDFWRLRGVRGGACSFRQRRSWERHSVGFNYGEPKRYCEQIRLAFFEISSLRVTTSSSLVQSTVIRAGEESRAIQGTVCVTIVISDTSIL